MVKFMVVLVVLFISIQILELLLSVIVYRHNKQIEALKLREVRSQMYLANELKRFNNNVEQARKERYGEWA